LQNFTDHKPTGRVACVSWLSMSHYYHFVIYIYIYIYIYMTYFSCVLSHRPLFFCIVFVFGSCLSISCTPLFVSIGQVIGCEDHLRNDLYCVGWGVKLYSLTPHRPLVCILCWCLRLLPTEAYCILLSTCCS